MPVMAIDTKSADLNESDLHNIGSQVPLSSFLSTSYIFSASFNINLVSMIKKTFQQ